MTKLDLEKAAENLSDRAYKRIRKLDNQMRRSKFSKTKFAEIIDLYKIIERYYDKHPDSGVIDDAYCDVSDIIKDMDETFDFSIVDAVDVLQNKLGTKAIEKERPFRPVIDDWKEYHGYGIKDSEKISAKLKKTAKKLSMKKLKLKENITDIDDWASTKTHFRIFNAGRKGEIDPEDMPTAIFYIIDKVLPKIDYYDTYKYLIKIHKEWNISFLIIEKAIKKMPRYGWAYDQSERLLDFFPKGIEWSEKETERIKKTAKKLPMKKLKLENILIEAKEIEDLETARDIYYAGKNWKQFDCNKGLNALIKKDKAGVYIYYAGDDWKQFDYKKGLDALIEKDYYKAALENWPKGIDQSREHIKQLAKTAKKLPMKKLKLENTLNEADMYMGVKTIIKDPSLLAKFEATNQYVVEPKMDGIWASAHTDRKGKIKEFHSRTGKAKISKGFATFLNRDINLPSSVLIGELITKKDELHIFDIIKYKNRNILGLDNEKRRKILEGLKIYTNGISLVPRYKDNFVKLFNALIKKGGEGLVLKKIGKGTKYIPGGRTPDWAKIKPKITMDYVIMGFTKSESKKYGGLIKAIRLGLYKGGQLKEVGKVGSMKEADRKMLTKNQKKLIGKVVEVGGNSVFPTGATRHPYFIRLRPDLRPEDANIEKIEIAEAVAYQTTISLDYWKKTIDKAIKKFTEKKTLSLLRDILDVFAALEEKIIMVMATAEATRESQRKAINLENKGKIKRTIANELTLLYDRLFAAIVNSSDYANFNLEKAIKIVDDSDLGLARIRIIESWKERLPIEYAQLRSKSIKKSAKKLPGKKLKLEDILNEDKVTRVLAVGTKKGYSKNLFRELINVSEIATPPYTRGTGAIQYAVNWWPNFDYKEAEKMLADAIPSDKWLKVVLKALPPSIDSSKKIIKKIAKDAKKLPMKKLKLKEDDDEDYYISQIEEFLLDGEEAFNKGEKFGYKDSYFMGLVSAYISAEDLSGSGYDEADKKADDALLDLEELIQQAEDWKGFDYKFAVDALASSFILQKLQNIWEKKIGGIRDTERKGERIRIDAKKLPMKKLKLEGNITEQERASELLYIVAKGEHEGYSNSLFKELISEIAKTGGFSWRFFNMAVQTWPNFSFSEAEKIIKSSNLTHDMETKLISLFPMNIKQSEMKSKLMKKSAKKLPMKKLKLKEETSTEETRIEDLETAEDILDAGLKRKEFDFNKGLDALIKKDKSGRWIFDAATGWKQFDFNKGLDALIKIGRYGEYIYLAGLHWKQFDYKKGLKALKTKSTYFYKDALRDWPKGINQSIRYTRKIAKTAKKLPMKKFKLKESVENYE